MGDHLSRGRVTAEAAKAHLFLALPSPRVRGEGVRARSFGSPVALSERHTGALRGTPGTRMIFVLFGIRHRPSIIRDSSRSSFARCAGEGLLLPVRYRVGTAVDQSREGGGDAGGGEAAPGSLVVLPEMFATGFSMDVAAVTDEPAGKTRTFLKQMAAEFDIVLLGGRVTGDATPRGGERSDGVFGGGGRADAIPQDVSVPARGGDRALPGGRIGRSCFPGAGSRFRRSSVTTCGFPKCFVRPCGKGRKC